MGAAFTTIVGKRELPYARVLADSLARVHPDLPLLVLLADEVEGAFDPDEEPFELVRLSELAIPELPRVCFLHQPLSLSYAATPFLLSALLDRGFDRVVFVKQESLVLGAQRSVLEELEDASVVLTPHLLAPPEDEDPAARERLILLSGSYNGGVVGVRRSEVAANFLAWWGDRVRLRCVHAVADGMHFEQRWLDLAPVFFSRVRLLRDRRANVGHWNLPERSDLEPALLRFSGFDPRHPEWATRYSKRLATRDLGNLEGRFHAYAEALCDAGWDEARSWPYAYGRFANGVPIPDLARELYARTDPDRFPDPFRTGGGSFYTWLNEPQPGGRATRLWHAVYDRRPDVQAAFPDPSADGFLAWTEVSGLAEHGIDAAFLPADLGSLA